MAIQSVYQSIVINKINKIQTWNLQAQYIYYILIFAEIKNYNKISNQIIIYITKFFIIPYEFYRALKVNLGLFFFPT